MYSLRLRFTETRSCLADMRKDMGTIVGRHIRRSVDDQSWAAAQSGWTVGRIHAYAMNHGMRVQRFSEFRGDYTLSYIDRKGTQLNALEDASLEHTTKPLKTLSLPKTERRRPDGTLLVGSFPYGNENLEAGPTSPSDAELHMPWDEASSVEARNADKGHSVYDSIGMCGDVTYRLVQ